MARHQLTLRSQEAETGLGPGQPLSPGAQMVTPSGESGWAPHRGHMGKGGGAHGGQQSWLSLGMDPQDLRATRGVPAHEWERAKPWVPQTCLEHQPTPRGPHPHLAAQPRPSQLRRETGTGASGQRRLRVDSRPHRLHQCWPPGTRGLTGLGPAGPGLRPTGTGCPGAGTADALTAAHSPVCTRNGPEER